LPQFSQRGRRLQFGGLLRLGGRGENERRRAEYAKKGGQTPFESSKDKAL